jgi:hypothetical protein
MKCLWTLVQLRSHPYPLFLLRGNTCARFPSPTAFWDLLVQCEIANSLEQCPIQLLLFLSSFHIIDAIHSNSSSLPRFYRFEVVITNCS